MSIAVYSISAITTPDVQYVESTYKFKQNLVKYDQGFTLNNVNALTNIYDSSINNYDYFYLTDNRTIGDFLELDSSNISTIQTITTPLAFNLNGTEDLFLKLQVDSGNNTSFTTVTDFSYTDNSLFYELEFIDSNLIRVLHNINKGYFILSFLLLPYGR